MSKRTTPAKAAAAKRAAFSNQRAQMAQRKGKPPAMTHRQKTVERHWNAQTAGWFGVCNHASWVAI